MAIVLGIPCVIVLATLLFGRQVFGSFIGIEQQLQYTYFYQDAVIRGDSALWNPYNFSGFPTFADLNIGFFSPLVYLGSLFLSVPALYYWMTLMTMILSGLFSALLMRSFNVSILGQYIAGLIFIFVTRQQWPDLTVMESFMLLPGILWLLHEIARSERRKITMLAGTLGAMLVLQGWLGGHWHFVLNALLVGGLFAVYLFWIHRSYRILVSYVVMVLMGTFFGLFKMIPVFVMMSHSARAGGFGETFISGEGFSLMGLFTLLSPSFAHPLFQSDADWIYLGLLSLFLAAGALTWRLRSHNGFFTYLMVFSALLGVRGLPFFAVLQRIPPFTFTHSAVRWIYVVGFAIAVLAGFGIDQIKKGTDIQRWRAIARRFTFTFFIFTVASIAGAIVTRLAQRHARELLFLGNKYFEKYYYHASSPIPLESYHVYIAKMFNQALSLFNIGNDQFFFALIFIAVSSFIVWFFASGYITPQNTAIVISIVLVGNFIGTHIFFGDRFARTVYEKDPVTVSFLKNKTAQNKPEDDVGRVISFLDGRVESEILENIYANSPPAAENFQLYSATLVPSRNIKYGITSAGYNATITNLSMARAVGYIGGQVQISDAGTGLLRNLNLSVQEKSRLFTHRRPIISLLGIRYITSAYALDEKVFPKVFETTATSYNIPVYIYENTEARPLYYFTQETELLDLPTSTTPQELQTLIEKTNKTHSITQEGIALQERKNASLKLTTNTSKPQLLVFSQNNLPGWRVFIDDQRVPLHTFATVYQAIVVPPGTHDIRFKYSYWEIWREFLKKR